MRTGTAAGVRSRGFTVPAAGKTGTSHDGWFAGFTSDLLCIVWVGFDDYSQLNMEGARSALPVWTEFMKRAIQLRPYSSPKEFPATEGVVTLNVDPQSGLLAGPGCAQSKPEVFIAGTEPVGICSPGGVRSDQTIVSGWDAASPPVQARDQGASPLPPRRDNIQAVPAPSPYQNPPDPKKKGFFGKLKSVFK
jgi:penicillin-binding protein 1B